MSQPHCKYKQPRMQPGVMEGVCGGVTVPPLSLWPARPGSSAPQREPSCAEAARPPRSATWLRRRFLRVSGGEHTRLRRGAGMMCAARPLRPDLLPRREPEEEGRRGRGGREREACRALIGYRRDPFLDTIQYIANAFFALIIGNVRHPKKTYTSSYNVELLSVIYLKAEDGTWALLYPETMIIAAEVNTLQEIFIMGSSSLVLMTLTHWRETPYKVSVLTRWKSYR